ncbi:MAG: ribbon-helix-helix domain-containing protein [Candidatus Hodarchaeota archaeon]
MKIITINLSEPHIKALQVLQDIGLYPSRSEAIRVAIRDFLQKELGFAQNIEKIDQTSLDANSSVEDRKKEISRLIRKLEKDQRVETAAHY